MVSKIHLIILLAVLVEISILGTAYYFGNMIIEAETNEITNKYSNRVILLAKNIESQLDSAANIIEASKNLPVVKNTNYSSFISEEYKGIPGDVDIKKRKAAQDILKQYQVFEVITFHMPNGDFYLMEPYSDQLNLTRLNFADRDWYLGVINTGKLYLSEVYESTTTKRNVAAIRTPIFDGDKLIGIWGGNLKLEFLKDLINDLILEKNLQIMYYDQYGKIILDTNTENNPIIPPGIISKAISGKKDIVILDDLVVAFSPISLGSVNWALLVIQPYDDAFYTTIFIEELRFIMATLLSLIVGGFSYFVYAISRKNFRLTNDLQNASIKKEEFSAMVTHELKTPLMPILGYCKMLKNNMLGNLNKEQLDSIESIEKNAKQLETLISDIMDARKLELDKMKFHIEDLSIDEFFANLGSSYQTILKDSGKDFTIKPSFSGGVIRADRTRLRQVFDNIIGNSIKFTANNGKIEVGAYKQDNHVVFYVKDNGCGIPPEKQHELFQKFYQIDTSERRPVGGTGLGLVISKGIVKKLGGTIWLESDGKMGTTVYMKFALNG